MNRTPNFQAGDTLLRYFRLDQLLVNDPGGATFWRAHHSARNETVSLLILPPELFHLSRTHQRIAAAIRELKPFGEAGFLRITDFHFGGSEAAIELEAIGGEPRPLSGLLAGGRNFDDQSLKRLFDGIAAPMEKLHHRGIPWGRLTPWQVLLDSGDETVRLLPPRIHQILAEELTKAVPDHADTSIALYASPEDQPTLAGDVFSLSAILRKTAGDRAAISDSLDQVMNASSSERPKDIFALRTRLFSGGSPKPLSSAKSQAVPASGDSRARSGNPDEIPAGPAILENPAFLKIAAFGTAAVILLILAFSLLTGGNENHESNPDQSGEYDTFLAEDFDWLDQPAVPVPEEALPQDGGETQEGAGVLVAANLPEESESGESDDSGALPELAGITPAEPAENRAETTQSETVEPESRETGDENPTAALSSSSGSASPVPSGSGGGNSRPVGGEIAALPADAELREGDETDSAPGLKPPVEPSGPPSSERIPPPPMPEALTRSTRGIEIVAPTRPEGQEREKVYGHTRTPVTRKQWLGFKSEGSESETGAKTEENDEGPAETGAASFVRVKKEEASEFTGWLTQTDRKAEVISPEQAYRLPRSSETRNQTIWREEDQPAGPADSRPFGLVLATADEKPVPPKERKTREPTVRINPRGIPVKDIPEDESAVGRQGKADSPIWKRPGR